ncbi:MAG: hypothetical protein MSJ26_03220 [Oscillospiraceae bacterium]|nr:hypothetical protein [Oscillospiraceae bacterium]
MVQNGELSDLIYVMQTSDIGGIFIIWIIVLLIVFVLIYTSAYADDDEEEMPVSKKKNGQKKKRRKKKNKDGNADDTNIVCLPWKYLPKHNGTECVSEYG